MAPQFFLSIVAFICILTPNVQAFSSVQGHGAGRGMQFTYSGSTGPEKWGSLSPNFSTCSNGKSQSPINIMKQHVKLNKNLKPLTREYTPANATLVNHLVHVGLHYGENSGELKADGKSYKLMQMHWHTPSEHTLNGVQYPAELHLVHRADNGSFSVVALLYRLGKPDPLISKIQDKLHKLASHASGDGEGLAEIPLGKFNLRELRKKTRKYLRYSGSLTTPPCTENVNWFILGKVRSISNVQLEALRAPLVSSCKHNSRPVQPLNERHVQLFEAKP